MELANQILKNQQSGLLKKNDQLVKIKLRELVFDYTDEVVEVLHKTGVAVSSVLPDNVILTIVVKHLDENNELREVISQMLIELDGHYNLDGQKNGQGLAIIGSSLSAVGNILAGIGRGQYQNTDVDQEQQEYNLQKQQQEKQAEQDKKRRTTFIIISFSVVLLITAILLLKKPKAIVPQVQINAT